MISTLSTYLLTGLVLGLSGGLSPGPLLMLVISETLRHGTGAGIRVALAPLITDLPIVLIAIVLLAHLSTFEPVLGVIALLGGIVLGYYGYQSLRFSGAEIHFKHQNRSLMKGVMANLLNPNPYLFWFAIGAPTTLKALDNGLFPAGVFIVGFYLILIGSKVLLAILVGKSRHLLKSTVYVGTIRLLGIALLGFAVFFVADGLSRLHAFALDTGT